MMKRCFDKVRSAMVFALVFAVGLLLAACEKSHIYCTASYANASSYTSAANATFDKNQIANVDVEWVNGAVVLDEGKGDGWSIIETYKDGNPTASTTMHYFLEGQTLRIRYSAVGRFAIDGLMKYLYVVAPRNVKLGTVSVKSATANISVSNVAADDVSLLTEQGYIKANCTAERVKASATAGGIYVAGTASDVFVNTVSGTAIVACDDTPSRLVVTTSAGDVILKLTGNTGFRLAYNTESGLLINAFNADTHTVDGMITYLDGANIYTVSTTSGNLAIENTSEQRVTRRLIE